MKAAIIGAGFAGDVHATALRACGVEMGAVVCLVEEEARRFAEKWRIPQYGTDVAQMLKSEIEVVHICTPPTTHGALIRQCLQAGKHVLCEKPLSTDYAEARELAQLEQETDRICAMVLNVRYHMACQRAKEILASGDLGRIYLIHGAYMQEFSAFPAPYDWRYREQVAGKMRTVTELGTHWFDVVQHVSGQKVDAVSAQFGCFNRERILKDGFTYPADSGEDGQKVMVESEDAAVISLRYDNGAIGSLLLSGVSPGRGNHLNFEIACERGNLWWNEEENNVLHIGKKGEGIRKEVFAFGNGFSDTFVGLMQAFYDAVEAHGAGADGRSDADSCQRTGTCESRYPGFSQGAEICEICEAVYRSSREDSRWVRIQEVRG